MYNISFYIHLVISLSLSYKQAMASLKAIIGSEHKELLRNKGKKRNQILQNLKSIKVSFLWGAFPEAPWHDYCLSSAPPYHYVEITRLLIVSLTKPEIPCG